MLSSSPAWTKTLFIITYDEHGGFFDHVVPPGLSADETTPAPDPLAPMDDDPRHRRYGVRVPAFVISPWVPQGFVSGQTYDHTSVLSTALRRFCPDAAASMGQRVAHANDLGAVLSRETPRGDVPPMPAVQPPAAGAAPVRLPDSFGEVLRAAIFGV